jgi:site-specific DNA-methyltransferase (adenine-specific)
MSKKFYVGDCHDLIKELEGNSIDLIYINPPFATTANDWDKKLRWKELFSEMHRVVKPEGNIVIHTAVPFMYEIVGYEKPNYHFAWQKTRPTGHLNAKKEPLRDIEEILVYKNTSKAQYFPQMRGEQEYHSKREKPKGTKYTQQQKSYESNHKGSFPRLFLGKYPHITQKNTPKSIADELTRFIINSYTQEGDTIFDFCCCDSSNGTIAESMGRNYIGTDISDKYFGKSN